MRTGKLESFKKRCRFKEPNRKTFRLLMTFIDFKIAFDAIGREKVVLILHNKCDLHHIVKAIQTLESPPFKTRKPSVCENYVIGTLLLLIILQGMHQKHWISH